nr:MAG TPA: helix-turn-helix domain protein [Caudoviricetes sp.]
MKENVINLKEVRDKIGLTQKETADKLGISLRTYQRYELDGDGIDYKKLLEISKKLGVSMEQLTGAVAIGSGNIAVRGNGNQIDKQRSQKRNTPLYIEFEKLYDDYGNETLLKGFVEKLKKLKEFSEE